MHPTWPYTFLWYIRHCLVSFTFFIPLALSAVPFYTNLLASALGVAGLHLSVLIFHATCSMEVEAMGGEEKAFRI
jgi:hypothetical protein